MNNRLRKRCRRLCAGAPRPETSVMDIYQLLVHKLRRLEVLLARQNYISAARFGYFLRRGLQRSGPNGLCVLGGQGYVFACPGKALSWRSHWVKAQHSLRVALPDFLGGEGARPGILCTT